MKIICPHCGKSADKATGVVNRARRCGLPIYCGRRCMGLARRKHKTKAQRIEEKRLYDQEYRRINLAKLTAKKAAYHQRTYDPAKARIERKKRAKAHAEYCRRPEYKAYKRKYDRQYRAREYGAFAEAFMLAVDLNREIKKRMTNHEIKWQNKTANKTQFRRRADGKADRSRPRIRGRRRDHPPIFGA